MIEFITKPCSVLKARLSMGKPCSLDHDFSRSIFPSSFVSVTGDKFKNEISSFPQTIGLDRLLVPESSEEAFLRFLDFPGSMRAKIDDCLDSSLSADAVMRKNFVRPQLFTNCPYKSLNGHELAALRMIHFYNIVNVEGSLYIVDYCAEQFEMDDVSPVVIPWAYAAANYGEFWMYFSSLPDSDAIAFAALDLPRRTSFSPLIASPFDKTS